VLGHRRRVPAVPAQRLLRRRPALHPLLLASGSTLSTTTTAPSASFTQPAPSAAYSLASCKNAAPHAPEHRRVGVAGEGATVEEGTTYGVLPKHSYLDTALFSRSLASYPSPHLRHFFADRIQIQTTPGHTIAPGSTRARTLTASLPFPSLNPVSRHLDLDPKPSLAPRRITVRPRLPETESSVQETPREEGEGGRRRLEDKPDMENGGTRRASFWILTP
jgi:hypothetical protein